MYFVPELEQKIEGTHNLLRFFDGRFDVFQAVSENRHAPFDHFVFGDQKITPTCIVHGFHLLKV